MKKTLLKSLLSGVVFSLGVFAIGFIALGASNLSMIKADPAGKKLPAENWDKLVDAVIAFDGDIAGLNGNVTTLSGGVATINSTINDLLVEIANLKNQMNDLDVPAGSVMAFDLSSCPSGWTRFADADGRFIMGASTNSKEKGGNSSITLAWNQLPPHSHYVEDTAYLENGNSIGDLDRGSTNGYYRNDWQLPGNLYGSNKTDQDNEAITFLRRTSSNLSNAQGGPRYGAIQWSQYDGLSSYTQTSMDIQNPYVKLIYCKKN